MNVSDLDEGVNGEFNCSMQPASAYFGIQNKKHSCDIVLKSSLNDTEQLQYIFDVTVQDNARDQDKRRYYPKVYKAKSYKMFRMGIKKYLKMLNKYSLQH